MELDSLLRAHAFLRVERPPVVWPVRVELEALVRLLGEMISAALVRGSEVGEVGLQVADVEAPEDPESPVPGGLFVALTIGGVGDWRPEVHWRPDAAIGSVADTLLLSADVDAAARAAAVPYAYTRQSGDRGSITIFLPAETEADAPPGASR